MMKELRKEIRSYRTDDSTGVLARSLGVVVRTNRSTLETSVRVGAIRKTLEQVPLKQTRKGKRYFVNRKASRYFHLSAPGRDGAGRVRRIFNATKVQAGAIVAQKVGEMIDKEVQRNALL